MLIPDGPYPSIVPANLSFAPSLPADCCWPPYVLKHKEPSSLAHRGSAPARVARTGFGLVGNPPAASRPKRSVSVCRTGFCGAAAPDRVIRSSNPAIPASRDRACHRGMELAPIGRFLATVRSTQPLDQVSHLGSSAPARHQHGDVLRLHRGFQALQRIKAGSSGPADIQNDDVRLASDSITMPEPRRVQAPRRSRDPANHPGRSWT